VTELDPDVLIAVCRRRPQALAELVARFQAPLYAFLSFLCGPEAAPGLFVETWRAVFRRAGNYAGRAQAARWIFSIARERAAGKARPAAPAAGETLGDAIEALAPDCREIYLLRECGQLHYAEIAESLRIPLESALERMGAALDALRPRLEDSVG